MSLRKSLSSPAALFIFEAAARHLNFTRAAAESNVTQSAVSRMIKQFEVHLGIVLFKRTPKGLELTDEGQELYKAVRRSFREVEAVLEELGARRASARVVTLSISSAFAMHWFVPRVDQFQAAFPDIDLRFQIVNGEPTGPFEDVDLAIRFNHPVNDDQHSWKLMDEIIVPVCSSDYAAEHGTLASRNVAIPQIFADLSGPLRVSWPVFRDKTGAPSSSCDRLITFSDYALVVQAALKGRGIALGWLHVVGHELIEEGLIFAGPEVLRTGFTYDIVATKNRPLRKSTILVRDWIMDEMRAIETRLMPDRA